MLVAGIAIYLLFSCVERAAHDAAQLNSSNAPHNEKNTSKDNSGWDMPTPVNTQGEVNSSQVDTTANEEGEYGKNTSQFVEIITTLQKGLPFDNSPHYWQVANAAVQNDGVIMILGKCLVDTRLQEISAQQSGVIANDGRTLLYRCGRVFSRYEGTVCPLDPRPCDDYGLAAAYYAEQEIK